VSTHRRLPVVFLAWSLLLLAAWCFWLWQLDASDLTFDESATYRIGRGSMLQIVSYLQRAVREHPPVYYLLIHGWMAVAGSSEFSLRFFSVAVGLVGVALVGWVARLTRTSAASARGLLPALLLAAAPGMAYYARDARMYSLGVVWTLLSGGLFLRDWLSRRDGARRPKVFVLATVHLLALFTHYYLLLPVLVQPLALLAARRWRALRVWCAAHGLLAFVGLTWLWMAPGLQATGRGLWQTITLTIPTAFQVFHLLGKILFSPVVQVPFRLLYWLLALAGGGILIAIWRRWTVGLWLLLTSLVPLALSFQLPEPPEARYLIFLPPFLALALGLLATAPLQIGRRWLAWSAGGALSVGMISLLTAGGLYQAVSADRSHYGRTLETVKAYARPGDGLLFYGPWQWLQFEYYDPGGLPPITPLPRYAPPHLDPEEAELVLEDLVSRFERLWVIPAAVDDVDPSHYVMGWLRTHTHAVRGPGGLGLFLPPLPSNAPSRSVQVTFEDALVLESVAWEPEPVPAGEALRLTLRWRPLRSLAGDMHLILELADSSGYAWVRTQSVPGEWAYPPSQWEPDEVVVDYEGLLVPQGAPPGDYVVRVMVTDGTTGEALPTGDAAEADLVTITVGEPSYIAAAREGQPARPAGDYGYRVYLPLVAAADALHAPGPVLYGLADADPATFCSPQGDDCLTLIGRELETDQVQQGYPALLALHWLSPERPLPPLQVILQVVRPSRLPLPGLRAAPITTRTLDLTPLYPAPLWSPGRLVSLPKAIRLPADAPVGGASITLQVLDLDGTPWVTADGRTTLPLFDLTVRRRPSLRTLPWGISRTRVDFGDEIALRGYRVEGEARPGGEVRVTYYWYARAQPSSVYAVFNHLVTADGLAVAQADGWPQEGRMLTTQWQPGDYVEDRHTLHVPADAPPGPYRLYSGLYRASSGERLAAFLEGERLPADQVQIPLPGQEEP
jgi:mannosyltransferase